MATAKRPSGADQELVVEQKIQKIRELYADASELAKAALEKGLPALKRELAAATGTQNAGRIGARQGKVSELTGIFPFAKGGAKRLRGLLQLLEGNFKLADAVGTVHDMRFVFLDNDTSCSSPPPTTASGTPTSTTSRRRFPTLWICCSAMPWAGRGFGARR